MRLFFVRNFSHTHATSRQSLLPCVSSSAFFSPPSGHKPYFREDHFSGGRPFAAPQNLAAIGAIADIGPGSPASTTLGNMRANGVRTLAAWCLGHGCNHHSISDCNLQSI